MSSQPATRDTLLLAALRVLARDGVPAATTRAIAAEAEVNIATLHYHFGSKDGLLAEVVEALSSQFAETVRAAIPTDGGIRDTISLGLRAVWLLAQETRGLQLAQYELTTAALRAHEPQRAHEQYAAYHRVIGEIVTETLTCSGEELAVAAEDLVLFLVAGMDGIILSALVLDRDASARALDLFIDAALVVANPVRSHQLA